MTCENFPQGTNKGYYYYYYYYYFNYNILVKNIIDEAQEVFQCRQHNNSMAAILSSISTCLPFLNFLICS